MADGNPFDTPLASEQQDHQQAQAATVQSSDNGNPFDEPLMSEKANQQQLDTGEATNDVGNKIIVPKDGESFADTMKRASAYGKTVTPEQIKKETDTAPKKIAETLVAAPALGAGGAGTLESMGEVGPALRYMASEWGQPAVEALQNAAKAHPLVAKVIAHGLADAGMMGLAKYMKVFGK